MSALLRDIIAEERSIKVILDPRRDYTASYVVSAF